MTTQLQVTSAETLSGLLQAARARTLSYIEQLSDEQWLGPQLDIVNPPLWEVGHVGWFQEYWCLRYRQDGTVAPSILAQSDALYNSAMVAHHTRWDLPLPLPKEMQGYLCRILDAVLERIASGSPDSHLDYFVQLAVFHELMHDEAFHYTLQTLGRGSFKTFGKQIVGENFPLQDVLVSGGMFSLGACPDDGFVFDNEKWRHDMVVAPFRMSRTATSNAQFAAFVDDGGYGRREFWSEAGWRWREGVQARHPVYWEKRDGVWLQRRGADWVPLEGSAAVIHVNWYEAEAWCRWAGRRLPTEAEWEFAASTAPGDPTVKRRYPWGDAFPEAVHANLHGAAGGVVDVNAYPGGDSGWGIRQMLGNVWEWTGDWFNPYPGFVRDPYKEYSEPWFGSHKALRGGCYATSACLLRNTWRNFYTPERRDVLAGFRTCVTD